MLDCSCMVCIALPCLDLSAAGVLLLLLLGPLDVGLLAIGPLLRRTKCRARVSYVSVSYVSVIAYMERV